jgi:DNA-directed RNA polymerase subunit delta
LIEAVEVRTEDTIYLVKVSTDLLKDSGGSDDDEDDDDDDEPSDEDDDDDEDY